MELLNILKKHYEKFVLSIVLLGLAVAAAILLLRVTEERQRLSEYRTLPPISGSRPLETIDVSANQIALRRLERPPEVVLRGTNNLFNPVQWQRRPDGRLVKLVTGDETGAGALRITALRPLHLEISYVGQIVTDGFPQYQFRIERQAAASPADRRPTTISFASIGSRNTGLQLRDIRPRDDPREFVFESIEDRTQMVVSVDEPYRAVVGYTVDLRYDPDNRSFPSNRRVGDTIHFAGDRHKIVAITATNVTVEASNRKRTTIPYHAAASPSS